MTDKTPREEFEEELINIDKRYSKDQNLAALSMDTVAYAEKALKKYEKHIKQLEATIADKDRQLRKLEGASEELKCALMQLEKE